MKYTIRPNIMQIEPYRPGKPIEELERELGIQDTVKLASNENCLGPSPLALKVVREAIDKSHLYPDGGAFALKQKLSSLLRFPEEQICVGSGSSELITLLALITCGPRDSIVMSAQSFIMYKLSAQISDAQTVEVPLRNYRHDLEALAGAVRGNSRLLFMDNPINPTGTYVTNDEMDRFMDAVPPEILVVVDEAYSDFIVRDDYPDATKYLRERRNVAVLRTFSKIHGLAGFRIGYCVGPTDVIDGLNKARPPFNTTSLGQLAAAAALDDVDHVNRSRELVLQEMSFLERELSQRGYRHVPSVANFLLVDMGADARKVFEKLLPYGVIVRPMHGYNFPTSIRLTVGTHEENLKFLAAVDRMNECA